MKIKLPASVKMVIDSLQAKGYEAYAVGGCVRDSILGRVPDDWDITTSATPYEVKKVFQRTVDTGLKHGTVTVLAGSHAHEVTTYRIDGEYEDSRHPKSVEFTRNLEEDLKRRDFTINAMAYSHETGIVDEFGGMADLAAGVIRCVGNPVDRFTEDALRILRAIRFSAQLNFSIEPETKAAITAIAPNLSKVSKERIQVELTKLLLSDHPEQMALVYETGISPYVSDVFHHVDYRRMQVNPQLPKQKHIRWAAFLKNEEEAAAVKILKDLKLDNDTIFRVQILNRWADRRIEADKVELRRAMSQMEPSLFDDLLILKQSGGEEGVEALKELAEEIRRDGDCISLKELAVTGKDLLAAGMKPGKQVGDTLGGLLALVLEHPELNRKEILLEKVKEAGIAER